MEIRLLRYVVTLSEELHFGRAAARHHISPQPFGQYIRRLEREVGTPLFERTSRRVTPTPAGVRLVGEARVLLDAVDELAAHARADGAERDERTLRLGVLGFGAGHRWDDLRTALGAQTPGLRLEYADLDWATQYRAVLDRTVDAGIMWHAGPVEELRSDVVLSSPRVAVVPARSPLADAPRLTMDDVAEGPWLSTPRLNPHMRDWLGPAALAPGPNAPLVRRPAAVPTAVATSGCIALAHEVARDFYPHPDVRFVPLEGSSPEIAVVTRADDRRPAIAALRRAAHFARARGRERGQRQGQGQGPGQGQDRGWGRGTAHFPAQSCSRPSARRTVIP